MIIPLMTEEGSSSRGRTPIDHDGNDHGFKSKNLKAERRRREKLRTRLLELRALVPIITNMNKATIITDAITYIEQLQSYVTDLSTQLMQMEEVVFAEEEPELTKEAIDAAEEMRVWGIEPEVTVTQIDANRLWIKIVCEKKRGKFTKLVEAVSVLGYEFTDTSVTTSKGAILVTSCLLGDQGGMLEANQIKEMLMEVIEGI